MKKEIRVGIACTGVGQVQRGFERYFAGLHRHLKDRMDITLFKGGGKSGGGEKRIRCLSRVGTLGKIIPFHWLIRRSRYHMECLTFALGLYPRVRRGGFDVVHCIDPPLARVMFQLRRTFGGDFRLLYTEGCAMLPQDYPPGDHMHHVAKQAYLDAGAFGYDDDHMTLIPCGIESARFVTDKSRAELRREHDVPEDKFVVLCLAAINRTQKRVDYLIDEVAKVDGDLMLWLDGSFDYGDPALVEYGKKVLGDRLRFSHLPSDRVRELYKLADVMVLASLHESFGLVVAEAMIAGTPVLVHDSEHFRWLVTEESYRLNMSQPEHLARRISTLVTRPAASDQRAVDAAADARGRFDWDAVAPDYASLYRKVSALPKLASHRTPRGEFFLCDTPATALPES